MLNRSMKLGVDDVGTHLFRENRWFLDWYVLASNLFPNRHELIPIFFLKDLALSAMREEYDGKMRVKYKG